MTKNASPQTKRPTQQLLYSKELRLFSKLTCFSTLFLIFAGGMVTSTGSGLAVPDWPLSYGSFFPPMVGGVFYEHGHRMIASLVGLCTLILAIWLFRKEKRQWVKTLGLCALFAVILQGVLGGLTVLHFLPPELSISHAVLAQTFFVLTIIIAFSQSKERAAMEFTSKKENKTFLIISFIFIIFVYGQLFLGALMRHHHAGLAVYDFPTMAGYWIPPMDEGMLIKINAWRFMNSLDPVQMGQVHLHLAHRAGALILTIAICILNAVGLKSYPQESKVYKTIVYLNILFVFQIGLGISTVASLKEPITTSLHVVSGAAILGLSVLLLLRSAPLTLQGLKRALA